MLDTQVRTAAFEWLARQVARFGDVLPRELLLRGFELDGQRIPLVGPQGIFKPKVLPEMPLSITTVPGSPYDDTVDPRGFLRYRYRGTDPDHPDNRGLRLAWRRGVPLVYFHGIVPGKYLATWPVYVVDDDPARLSVIVAVDQPRILEVTGAAFGAGSQPAEGDEFGGAEFTELRRRYATAEVRVRLHQRIFRERVLEAYRRQCAFCRLRHEELLDAAHIIPDAETRGEPAVSNGLALCTLHHRAFDRYFIGVTPDYTIEVRPDLLEEKDGPTLVYGLQALHGQQLFLPRNKRLRPDRDLLAKRHEVFRSAI